MRRFKIRTAIIYAIGITATLLSVAHSLPAQEGSGTGTESHGTAPATEVPPQNQSIKAQWAQFAWLEGRWQGSWGPRLAEQVWMAPKAGEMTGVFREVGNDKTLVLELFSLVETQKGIEYRSRHFTPSLAPWESSGPTILHLASVDSTQIVFENATDGKPKRVVFTRTSPDTYVSRSEIVPDQGDMQVVEITYHRLTVSAGSAGRR